MENVDFMTLIAALIGLAGSVIGVIVVEIVGWKKTLNRMGNCKYKPLSVRTDEIIDHIGVDKRSTCLTQQHSEIKEVLKNEILVRVNETKKTVSEMKQTSDIEREVKKRQELLLSNNELRIIQALDDIKTFTDLWRAEKELNIKLSAELANLKNENRTLKNIIEGKRANDDWEPKR